MERYIDQVRSKIVNNNIIGLKIPSHHDLGRMYLSLKSNDRLDEYLINATLRFIRDRWSLSDVIEQYFRCFYEYTRSNRRPFSYS